MFFASFYEVDDVKDIHNKALALELLEKLAKNVVAEDRCYQIRWRAANKAQDNGEGEGRRRQFEQPISKRGAVGIRYRTKNSRRTWHFKTAILRLAEARRRSRRTNSKQRSPKATTRGHGA
jgi:hypothetical protein